MTAKPTLTGYEYSVYTRSARMGFAAKGLSHDYQEIDPFDPAQAEGLRPLHPFGVVPVLRHGEFLLYETQAILDYVDMLGAAPCLTPRNPQARARMRQVMGIVDNYLYWPAVRQVVSHAIFLDDDGAGADRAMLSIEAAMSKSGMVLDVLEGFAREGQVLIPGAVSLADCHLWPMLDYFRLIPEGADMIAARPALRDWAQAMEGNPSAQATLPDLENLKR